LIQSTATPHDPSSLPTGRQAEPTEINFDFNQVVYVGEGSLAFD